MDAETLYRQLGRLIETAPDFTGYGALSSDQMTWLGRAHALIEAGDNLITKVEMTSALQNVQGPIRADAAKTVMMSLYKALAAAELKAPASAQGSFIPAGNRFDAFAAVTKVLQTATADVFIVDPYMDETLLTDFGGGVPQGVSLRLLSDHASVKSTWSPAVLAWQAQYQQTRPLGARLSPARALHDRAIFVDRTTAWLLTQSLKDFAKRSPAEIVRADDTAALKIAAYEALWNTATVVV